MMGGAWRVAMAGLVTAAAALVFLGMDIAGTAGIDLGVPMREVQIRDMAAAGIGLIAVWIVFAKLNRHFRDLGRLRDRLAGGGGRSRDDDWASGRSDEVGRLAQAAAQLARPDRMAERTLPGRPERSLSALLALADSPLLLLDDRGRVERLNAAAARLLDIGEGDDIGQALVRADLARAIERARGSGEATPAVLRRSDDSELSARVVDLGLNAGVALSFVRGGAGLSGTRTLSLRPAAPAEPLGDEQPLASLPFVALWVATAGPGPEEGPVVAVGTVRLAGARVFRTVSLSLLVDPATPIAAEATARHGIATGTVAGERPFAEVWPSVAEAMHHCLAVGVGVDMALAALARTCAQVGLPVPPLPPSLDLGALAVALEPSLAGAALDRLADAFGVAPAAAGPFAPALRQAELAAVLLRRLDARGIATHGQVRALLAGGSGSAPA
ncbi:DNA polymerase-3 subunit epsilon [Azospirillum agricola]|uniref:DNA polymerase III subunit epsilon n=1 Tax=Azospirillum agricola TaxID=1720247 RepID=UPI001AEB0F38|nr:DNA polymerase III subunit epsilon [Azospirillum agricola]MBP2231330.1 DNA polymerase-3 subunit epsilon [Azospirillum agricola]